MYRNNYDYYKDRDTPRSMKYGCKTNCYIRMLQGASEKQL